MLRRYRILALALLLSCSANGSNEKRFSGMGQGTTDEQAFSEAHQNAVGNLIREEFPLTYSVDEEFNTTQAGVSQQRRLRVEASNLLLSGVRLIDSTRSLTPQGNIEINATYAISNVDLENAKKAYRSAQKTPFSTAVQSTMVGIENPYRANIVVETKPSGALVSISDSIVLPSPLRLQGVLDPGSHTIRIDHPFYEPKLVRVDALPGKTVTIRETLERAAVKLLIESVPQSAIVRINGARVGMTPLIYDTLAGQTLDLSIEHPDTASREQRLMVARSPFWQTLRFALQYRQTYVQVVGPDIAGSYSISKGFRTTPLERGKQIQVDPGEYKVCFACFSKEQAKSTNCGEGCCRKATVLPGKLNIVSFHEELRSPTSVPDIREFSSDGVTERSAPVPATKAPPMPLFEISQSSVSAFVFDVGAETISIGKISTVIANAGISLHKEMAELVYFDLATHAALGESRSAGYNVNVSSALSFESQLGLKTRDNPSGWSFGLAYRIAKRNLNVKIDDSEDVGSLVNVESRSIEQTLRGPSVRIQNRRQREIGFLEIWPAESSSDSTLVRGGSSIRLNFGIGSEF